MPTQSQIDANRRNAQLSTGPQTADGKATSSLNALKTGLTGRTILLPGDDVPLYEATLAARVESYQPASDQERALVQSIVDTEWRLARIPTLEAGIYALGRLEFAPLFAEQDPGVRKTLIDAKVFLTYGRQLSSLSVQENRLRRQREKDIAELLEAQKERRRLTRIRLDQTARLYVKAARAGHSDESLRPQLGFEFPIEMIRQHALAIDPDFNRDFGPQSRRDRAA